MKQSIAIIPARGGSKRIPGKNVKAFCGKPMIAYSIQAALEIAVTYCLNRKRKGEKNENRRDCRNPYTVTQ